MMHQKLPGLLKDAQRILIYSGAGLSTGSGIPDFRGPNGVWKRRTPVYFEEFLRSEEKRISYWEYKLEGYEAFQGALPNAAHRAVALLEEKGKVEAVVTQNIDGLHQDAGAKKVIELHGTNREIECLSCQERSLPAPAFAFFRQTGKPPRCSCGGLLKPATISFGQSLRPQDLRRAEEAALRADLALALGTTLSVYPAASIPFITRKRGAPYVIINQGDTEHDTIATLKIEDDVLRVLPDTVDAL